MDKLRLSSSIRDLKSLNLYLSLVSEFLGTFLLVFIGFGTAYNNMNPVKLGLGFGLGGTIAIYTIGPISGGHINPAVSFGLLIARQISLIRWFFYSIIQIIGATVGFGLLLYITNGNVLAKSYWNVTTSMGTGRMDEVIHRIDSMPMKIVCELVITFVLVFTVMRLCVEKSRSPVEKGMAPLLIGLSITLGVYCGMNISGGSMNPAASLGKWFYKQSRGVINHVIGPLIGAFIAAVLQQLVFTSELSVSHVKEYLFDSNFGNYNIHSSKKNDHELTEGV